MTSPTRLIAAVVLAGAWTSGFLLAQTPTPAPQTPAPAAPAAPAGRAGRAAGRGQVAVPTGARSGGFSQFTRPLPSQEVIIRGKELYDGNCASCHAPDLRGMNNRNNPNLLDSGITLRDDDKGTLIGGAVAKHASPIRLPANDIEAIAGYIHSVQATMGGQGSPPGRNPTGITLNVLVGDATKGQADFTARCSSCHSVTGDLKGIGAKNTDPKALQGAWVGGTQATFAAAAGGGGGGRGGGGSVPATVTLANGTKLDGTLVRQDDFNVVMTLADGTHKVIPRVAGVTVQEKDPKKGHVDAIVKLATDDKDASLLHDITAYLATIK